ncbi:MAG: hypothetical protein R8K21_05555 [Mariprofundales bacterium]
MLWLIFLMQLLWVISAISCWWMLHHGKMLDVPNERSSHTKETPRGGGVGIVLAFIVGMLIIMWMLPDLESWFFGFIVTAVAIAALSLYDDKHTLSFKSKLPIHLVLIIGFMFTGGMLTPIQESTPAWFAISLYAGFSFLWLLGLTNAFNFMDGMDGMASTAAVLATGFFTLIALINHASFTHMIAASLLAAALGFLFFNLPPAKIFMGDVGSAFLGFAFAGLAILAYQYDAAHLSILIMPMLLLHFLFDTIFTFCRRAWQKEHVFLAHRGHLYQLCNRMGASHAQVSSAYALLAIIQGVAAMRIASLADMQAQLLLFIPFVLCYALAAFIILRKASKAGLFISDSA